LDTITLKIYTLVRDSEIIEVGEKIRKSLWEANS
jgi:hypothetical protein